LKPGRQRGKQHRASDIYRRVLAQRATFYGEIVSRDPSQHVFSLGWARRLAEFIESMPA
jgi:hypothetical protein